MDKNPIACIQPFVAPNNIKSDNFGTYRVCLGEIVAADNG